MRRRLNRKNHKALILLALCLFLTGCETVSYYSQSVYGHSKMMLGREPIDQVIERSDGKLKQQLLLTKQLRQFAVDALHLPENDSYLSYVDIKRDYPVWTVVATPEFSIFPVRWCYPVIGCAAYRGYFAKQAAEKYAQKMRDTGHDVMIGGVTAYSTLGWFNDPLIPPMLRRGDIALAELIFHELAHQQLYIKDNSAFNEAFATVVGEHGALMWMKSQKEYKEKVNRYRVLMQVRTDFTALIKDVKQQFNDLYAQKYAPEKMRQLKAVLFSQLREDYEKLKHDKWQGKAWYGKWFEQPLNNARIAAFATYRDLVPQFERLLLACGNDFARFYETVATQIGQGKHAKVSLVCAD